MLIAWQLFRCLSQSYHNCEDDTVLVDRMRSCLGVLFPLFHKVYYSTIVFINANIVDYKD